MQPTSDFKTRPHDSGEDALPLPTGTSIYESLTSRFVSFERLLATLGEAGHSGYVKLLANGANGIVLMRDGSLVESLFRGEGGLIQGEPAIRAIHDLVEGGSGVLDIVSLQAGVVDGLHGVASGRTTYPELSASWVNAEGLVRYLRERHFTGSVIVSGSEARGVIILAHGEITAAFTTRSGELEADADEVLALCSDPDTRLEVRELERSLGSSNGAVVASAVSSIIEGEGQGEGEGEG